MGTLSRLILTFPNVRQLTAIEPAENLFPLLLEQIGSDARVKLLKGYLYEMAAHSEADALIAVNVIEHVEDDNAFLRSAHRALVPGGTCILFAPAIQFLYGSLDSAFGHFRRYSKAELALKLQTAGFQIEELRYFNLPGVFAWFVAGRVLRKTTLRASDTRLYDRWVVPWISVLERFREPRLGQSVLAVARKPMENA
jgi:SAM-dependent methyltransferase